MNLLTRETAVAPVPAEAPPKGSDYVRLPRTVTALVAEWRRLMPDVPSETHIQSENRMRRLFAIEKLLEPVAPTTDEECLLKLDYVMDVEMVEPAAGTDDDFAARLLDDRLSLINMLGLLAGVLRDRDRFRRNKH